MFCNTVRNEFNFLRQNFIYGYISLHIYQGLARQNKILNWFPNTHLTHSCCSLEKFSLDKELIVHGTHSWWVWPYHLDKGFKGHDKSLKCNHVTRTSVLMTGYSRKSILWLRHINNTHNCFENNNKTDIALIRINWIILFVSQVSKLISNTIMGKVANEIILM